MVRSRRKKVSLNGELLPHMQYLRRDIFYDWIFSGAYSGAETHVPFPNTAVKGSSGDGTVNLTMGE